MRLEARRPRLGYRSYPACSAAERCGAAELTTARVRPPCAVQNSVASAVVQLLQRTVVGLEGVIVLLRVNLPWTNNKEAYKGENDLLKPIVQAARRRVMQWVAENPTGDYLQAVEAAETAKAAKAARAEAKAALLAAREAERQAREAERVARVAGFGEGKKGSREPEDAEYAALEEAGGVEDEYEGTVSGAKRRRLAEAQVRTQTGSARPHGAVFVGDGDGGSGQEEELVDLAAMDWAPGDDGEGSDRPGRRRRSSRRAVKQARAQTQAGPGRALACAAVGAASLQLRSTALIPRSEVLS